MEQHLIITIIIILFSGCARDKCVISKTRSSVVCYWLAQSSVCDQSPRTRKLLFCILHTQHTHTPHNAHKQFTYCSELHEVQYLHTKYKQFVCLHNILLYSIRIISLSLSKSFSSSLVLRVCYEYRIMHRMFALLRCNHYYCYYYYDCCARYTFSVYKYWCYILYNSNAIACAACVWYILILIVATIYCVYVQRTAHGCPSVDRNKRIFEMTSNPNEPGMCLINYSHYSYCKLITVCV